MAVIVRDFLNIHFVFHFPSIFHKQLILFLFLAFCKTDYKNDNGSTHYNNGSGYSRHTGSSGAVTEKYYGNTIQKK